MDATATVVIAILGTGATILSVVWVIKQDFKKDTKSETESITSVTKEMQFIARGIEDIKYDTRSTNSALAGINERLIRNEEHYKNLNDRVARIENCNKKGDK